MIRASLASVLALSTFVPLIGCSGTETDNPVAGMGGGDTGGDYESPDRFAPPPSSPPGCPPPAEDALEPPPGLPRALTFELPDARSLLVRGDYRGLELWDVSNPANLTRTSQSAVRGEIHQLLRSGPTELWVAATEPPALSQSTFPPPAALEPALHVLGLDVSDPVAPVRGTEATLDGDFWQMQQRGADLWVLTGRRVPEQRGCDAQQNLCGYRSYEAVELHGLHRNGSVLEPLASGELPLGRRVWWGADGIATVTDDAHLHVLRWDTAGILQASVDLSVSGEEPWNGPVDIVGHELFWVGYLGGHAWLYRFDLDASTSAPSSFDLGAQVSAPSAFSLLAAGELWLNPSDAREAAALWDLSGATPIPVALPDAFSRILPLPDATLDGETAALLALGTRHDPRAGTESFEVLALDGGNLRAAYNLGPPMISSSTPMPAPANLHGLGTAPAWEIAIRGAGLPLGLDPSTPPDAVRSSVQAFVGIPSDTGALLAEARLIDTYSIGATSQPNPQLEIHSASGTVSFEVSPGSQSLLAVPNGVVLLATEDVQSCPQTGRDCSGYAPGVTLFDVSTAPRLVASLPFPEPVPGVPSDPNRISIGWASYDSLTQSDRGPQALDARHLVFVADVELSCDNQVDCDSLGIQALPIAEAGVLVATPAPCPSPAIAPNCVDQPYQAPTVYGQSHRQYGYALQFAGAGSPRWQALGVSTLESNSGLPDRSSSFAAPLALDGTLAATRLERTSRSGKLLPRGQSRFMLDRFRLNAAGEPQALPAVNVPGYAVAYLGTDEHAEYWLSAEPLPGQTGRARLHRLRITPAGAESEQHLELDGSFGGLWPIPHESSFTGLVLSNPENACGVTRLSAVALGAAERGGALEINSTLDLPSDGWQLIASDGPRVLLRRATNYALVQLSSAGALQLSALRGSPSYVSGEQLLGTTLRGSSSPDSTTLEF